MKILHRMKMVVACTEKTNWVISCVKSMSNNKVCHFQHQDCVKKEQCVISCVKSMSNKSLSFLASKMCQKRGVCHLLCQEHVKQRSVSFLASRMCQKTKCIISCMKIEQCVILLQACTEKNKYVTVES